METDIQSAVVTALSKLRATPIDDDILLAFPELKDVDPANTEAVEATAKNLVERHQALFTVEKGWDQLDPDSEEYRHRDAAFKESLRNSRPIGLSEWKALDASRLDEEEFKALSKAVAGQTNSWDRGLLTRALARQSLENEALKGAAS